LGISYGTKSALFETLLHAITMFSGIFEIKQQLLMPGHNNLTLSIIQQQQKTIARYFKHGYH